MSILPKLEHDLDINSIIKESENLSSKQIKNNTSREYAWDFEKNDFLLKDGKFVVVEGIEALKIWIWKALNTVRFKYSIYSNQYGHDVDSLIGQGFSKSLIEVETKRMVIECLSGNSNIKNISNFQVELEGEKLNISFLVSTVFGDFTMKNVPIETV